MDRSRALALVLRLTGVAFIVVFTLLFLASVTQTDTPEFLYRLFAWGDIGDAEEQMLAAVYIVWGVCLWIAARAPLQHRLFIDFTITANLAHSAVMAVQSFTYQGEHAPVGRCGDPLRRHGRPRCALAAGAQTVGLIVLTCRRPRGRLAAK